MPVLLQRLHCIVLVLHYRVFSHIGSTRVLCLYFMLQDFVMHVVTTTGSTPINRCVSASLRPMLHLQLLSLQWRGLF